MVEYLMISVVVAILGLAAVVGFISIALSRARKMRELSRKRSEITSQEQLEDFIRRVDQVTAADELDHLDSDTRKDE